MNFKMQIFLCFRNQNIKNVDQGVKKLNSNVKIVLRNNFVKIISNSKTLINSKLMKWHLISFINSINNLVRFLFSKQTLNHKNYHNDIFTRGGQLSSQVTAPKQIRQPPAIWSLVWLRQKQFVHFKPRQNRFVIHRFLERYTCVDHSQLSPSIVLVEQIWLKFENSSKIYSRFSALQFEQT